MNPSIHAAYKRRLVTDGYCTPPGRAACALAGAKVEIRFRDLESRGLVRLYAEPEDTAYDGDGTPAELAEINRMIERDGYWIWCGQWRASEEDEWEYADNIGGIIGDDFGGCDVQIMQSAIDALDAHWSEEAGELAARATYAGVEARYAKGEL